MGNTMCNEKNQAETLVLQTGRMRGKHIEHGVDSLNMNNSSVIHRWLPSEFESKYEALDFVNKFNLNKLFPNPFNPVLNIDFEINQAGLVKVEISDITGAIVKIVYDGYMTMGKHQKSWNSENLPSGTYFVTLEFENLSLTKKVVLLK